MLRPPPPARKSHREQDITPTSVPVQRHRCPFYGFSWPELDEPLLIDQHGNRCALVRESHTPCEMEVLHNRTPDWEACSHKTDPAVEKPPDRTTVFPMEIKPPDTEHWSGIPLNEWMVRVMAKTVPRPEE